MEKLRVFVAIPLPEALLAELKTVQYRLQGKLSHRNVRWVRPKGIHLTLKFLGDTRRNQIPTVEAALEVVTRNAADCMLVAAGLGCFPSTRRPRVIWIGVQEDTGRLRALYAAVEEAMTSLGYKPERHSFTPHLTLGRVRRGASRDDRAYISEVVTGMDVGKLAQFRADRLELIRSKLKPTGAVYSTVKSFHLRGGRTQ